MGMKPPYTSRLGQFLAFIHHYTTLHGRPPAEAEMARFFQVTPPSVHSTILTLERRGLITRAPVQARSIALRLPPQELPPLYGSYAITNIPLWMKLTSRTLASSPPSKLSPFIPAMNSAMLTLSAPISLMWRSFRPCTSNPRASASSGTESCPSKAT